LNGQLSPKHHRLYVTEETIPGIADPAGDGRQGFDLRLIGEIWKAKTDVAAFRVGPGIVALDADTNSPGN
jgi:hypothetical protein